jgi:hypothetical protein
MAKTPKVFQTLRMDTKEEREKTVEVCFENAKNHKGPIAEKFKELDDYYHNRHYTNEKLAEIAAEKGWDFNPPCLTDAFIQVETQIDPLPPEFTFKGRDRKMDPRMATTRQDVVKFILYNNRFPGLLPKNERNLNKLGTAHWKVAFDGSITGPGYIGDITIGGPNPAYIFPDPTAYTDDDCEFIIYAYRMHKFKAWRTFNKRAQREILSQLQGGSSYGDTEIYTRAQEVPKYDDTFQVIEYWYKDLEGDIACSIQIEGHEVQWIKKYWERTRHSGNRMYPIITYYKIPDDMSFWGLGEIETVQDLIDAGDRELLSALLHDMYDADDMLIVESGALKEGTSITKTPGGIIWANDNRSSGIKRLGGMTSNVNALNMINQIKDLIQETNGSFDSAQGKEPIRVTTSSGIAQLNERAQKRSDIKKADRSEGFRRLYELLDWTALEFYNTDREIMIRGEGENDPDRYFSFNSDALRVFDNRKYEALLNAANQDGESIVPGYNDQGIYDQSSYYPRIDSEIVTTDGMKQSKAFQTQAASEVADKLDGLTPAKAELLKSNIKLMGLPNEQDILDAIDMQAKIQQQIQQQQMAQPQQVQGTQQKPPSETIAFKDLPPDGKIQMAAHAGIQLSPQSVIQQMQPQEGTHPVDQYYNSLSPEQQQEFNMMPQDQQVAIVKQSMGM